MTTYLDSTNNLALAVRRELLDLARIEDDLAATEAGAVPYWEPCPPSVLGHREAATALRAEADRVETEQRWARS
jgi:hypothetical protein